MRTVNQSTPRRRQHVYRVHALEHPFSLPGFAGEPEVQDYTRA